MAKSPLYCQQLFAEGGTLHVALSPEEKQRIELESRAKAEVPIEDVKSSRLMFFNRIVYYLTDKLNRWNPNMYYYYYFRKGIPQRTRFAIKVGVHFKTAEDAPEVLSKLGITLNEKDVAARNEKLGSNDSTSTQRHQIEQANQIFTQMLWDIMRYKSVTNDIRLLEQYSRLKGKLLETLKALDSDSVAFPMSLVVTERINHKGVMEENVYHYASRDEVKDHINVLENLESTMVDQKLAVARAFLATRLEEQSELRGMLYIYKAEIQKYSAAFGYTGLRTDLLKLINELYQDPSLRPPRQYRTSHYFNELVWEAYKFRGGMLNTGIAHKANELLRLNDIIDLGINEQRLPLHVKIRRWAILLIPVEASAALLGITGAVANNVYQNQFGESPRDRVVQIQAQGDFSPQLRSYFKNQYDFDIGLPRHAWPPEVVREYASIMAEREIFFDQLRRDEVSLEQIEQVNREVAEQNAMLFSIVRHVVYGHPLPRSFSGLEHTGLLTEVSRDYQRLSAQGMPKEAIELELATKHLQLKF